MNRGKRKIGLAGAISIGIGGMVGGGIFAVLGEAVSLAHGGTPMAFFVAGMVALLTSYAYARLSVKYPSQGGTVVFIDKAFGNNIASGSVNLMLWLSYLVTIALYAVAFASYALTFFHDNTSALIKHVLISAAVLLPTAINLVSASFVSKSETAIVAVKLVLLAVIIVFSVAYVDPELVAPAHWGSMSSIFAAGMIIFVAYEGFELIANSAEDVQNPERNLPIAFYSSVILVFVLYVLIGIITASTIPEEQLLSAKDYALAIAAKPALGQTGFVVIAIAALLATFSAINATIYGNARLGYVLAKEGQLPEIFDKKVWNEPVMGVVVTAAISVLMANAINLKEIAIIGSASFLFIFALINASAFKLRKEIGGSRYIYIVAVLLSVTALMTLLINTFESNFRAIFVFVAFICVSVLFEMTYGKKLRGHFMGRRYDP
ncbi:MAG: APC family permease [Chlorobiales bacterium]|nr:APC family permease [Chlorobiales bacterium]